MLVTKNSFLSKRLAANLKTVRAFGLFGDHKYDPRKHQNMDRHLHNSYANVYRWGEFPDWKITDKKKIPAAQYTNPCVTAVFGYLNGKYGCNITVENYATHKNNSWSVYGINIKEEMPQLLKVLASEVVCTDNKYRVNVEQRMRLEATGVVFSDASFHDVEITRFFTLYGHQMYWLAQQSNNWRAPAILGEYSQCEIDDVLKPAISGVNDLKQDHSVNNNVFNKFLRWAHS